MVTLKDVLKSITQSIKQVIQKPPSNNNENITTFNLIEVYKDDGQLTLDLIEKYMDEHPYLMKNKNINNTNNNNNISDTSNTNNNNNSNNNTIIQITTPNIPSNVSNTVATALVNSFYLTNTTSSSSNHPNQSNSSTTTNNNNINNPSATTTNGLLLNNPLIEEDPEITQIIDKFNVDLYNLYNTLILSSSSSSSSQGSAKITTVISCSPEAEKIHHQQFLFLYYYHALLPILGPQRLFTTFWYTKIIQPILSTSTYIEPIKKIARDIVSTSLCIEQQLLRRYYQQINESSMDINNNNNHLSSSTIMKTHGVYATQIIESYLEWIHLREKRLEEKNTNNKQDKITKMENDIRLQHQVLLDMEQEEWSLNLRIILMTLGAQETKTFFYLLNNYFQSSQHRLQIVYLFSEFMLRKRTHAHEILDTPLFDSMLKSLMYDNSTTLIAISVTNMIMLLPRICTSLQPYLPKLFYIFARAISWDQLRDLRKKRKYNHSNSKNNNGLDDDDTNNDQDDFNSTSSIGVVIHLPDGSTWDCADFTFSKLAAPPSNPQTGPFFTALYGLYPCQFLHFLHKPYHYFEKIGFQVPEEFDEEMFRNRVINHHVSRHMLHPNLITMDLDQEVVDRSHWMKMEPPDVIARIMSLDLTNAASRVAFYTSNNEEKNNDQVQEEDDHGHKNGKFKNSMDLLDTSLWKTAPTPSSFIIKSQLQPSNKEDDNEKEIENEKGKDEQEKKESFMKKKSNDHDKNQIGLSSPSSSSLSTTSHSGQSMINNILQLNRALKSGREVLVGDDIWDAYLEKLTSPSTTYITSSTPSSTSAVESDTLLTTSIPITIHSQSKSPSSSLTTTKEKGFIHEGVMDEENDLLGKNQLFLLSSSPIDSKDPQNNETKLLIAALKREVLLLRNELNFELFLKQQHLQHIARLHREHILDSTVEAERQHLYNTNRMLKAQLEKTTLLLDQMKSETILTKQKHIKWEDEQSNKLRGYREARKEWQAHMEKNKLMMNDYEQKIKDQELQLNQYQMKISDLEMDLQTKQPIIDQSHHYKQKVKQLTTQMLLWEEDISHLQEQKRYIKGLLSQWWSMEELVASLQHENQTLGLNLSQKENKISHLSKQLDNPSSVPSPKIETINHQSSTDHHHQQQHNTFFIKDSSTHSELGDMKRVIQDLREKLTLSEMEKMKYQAELEKYKSEHQSSPSKMEIEEESS